MTTVNAKNIEARREAFEDWAASNGWRDYQRYDAASTDEYMAYETQQRWECWNAALDSICVELPYEHVVDEMQEGAWTAYDSEKVQQALGAAGVPYK